MNRKRKRREDNDDEDEYVQNILYEVNMPNERRVNGENYIGNLKRKKYYHNSDEIKIRLSILEAQVEKLYNALEFSNVIKATPIISLVYANDNPKKCHDFVTVIYDKWIAYLTEGCQSPTGLNFLDIFHNIDRYIFDNYFKEYVQNHNLEMKVVPILDNKNNHNLDNNIEGYDSNNEFVSIVLENDKIIARYNQRDLSRVCTNERINNENGNNNNNPNDVQLTNPLHPHLSKNKSLIDQIDKRGVFVNFNNRRLVNEDRRFVILGSERPLFNTTVFTSSLNNLNDALHNTGAPPLNFSITIFHAMLHLKCFLEKGNYCYDHDVNFISELINFTPSVLFGHFLLPPVSISV